jgi:two-component system, cell cycle sensor histidine kinase and response regulator CckA
VPPEWRPLVEAVDEAYRLSDQDRSMLERSLELSSQELLQANADVRASEERYRFVVEQTAQIIYEVDVVSGEVDRHGAIEAVTGYTPAEFGRLHFTRWAELLHEEDAPLVLPRVKAAMEKVGPFQIEYRFRRKDGGYAFISDRGVSLPDGSGGVRRILGTMADVTEIKRVESALRESESQLRHAQKMEAIGQLAGGVAHDFNNLLTVIIGSADLVLLQLEADTPLHELVSEIQKAAARAAHLTSQLLAFSRKQVLQPKVLELNALLEDEARMLRRLIGEHVTLRLNLGDDVGRIKADPGQVQQVILNLAVNARDAMPHGGVLTVTTKSLELDADTAARLGCPGAARVACIEVTDTGHGMRAETLAHMFEPFFTTKELGRGTGLGLSTVYGIVRQSGGGVEVASDPGRGTTFLVYFPEVDASSAPPSVPLTATERISGTILLVEDEQTVRRLAKEILSSYGFTVHAARDADEALSLFESHADEIDLLLTDAVLPGLPGPALAHELKRRRPGLRVLFMSGYLDDMVARKRLLESNQFFLQKPFSRAGLLRQVQKAMQSEL